MNKNGWTKIWQSKDTRLLSIKSILFENNIFIVVLAGKNHSIKEKNGLSYRNIKVIEVHLLSKKLWHSLSFLSSITEQNLRLKIHNLNNKISNQ